MLFEKQRQDRRFTYRQTPYFFQRQKSKQKGWLLAEGIFLRQFSEFSIYRNFIIPALFMGGLTVVLLIEGGVKILHLRPATVVEVLKGLVKNRGSVARSSD